MTLDELIATLRAFAAERDWEQFHTPKNLAMAVAGEAGELVAELQWLTPEESVALQGEGLAAVSDEMADVLIYLCRLADVLGVDLLDRCGGEGRSQPRAIQPRAGAWQCREVVRILPLAAGSGCGITVAITGPTGEIGTAAVAALEREPDVERIVGMARRPFDPGSQVWTKTEYRRGDILNRPAVHALVRDADVVVHLAFVIMGSREQSRRVNIAGARNVFQAVVAATRPGRLVYTSSVAAYGYHRDNPRPLTEDVPARGSAQHYYSEQKAQLEGLLDETTAGSPLQVHVLRPCIVVGPRATALARAMPWNLMGQQVSGIVRSVRHAVPVARPVFPDPGIAVQLVHHDDVASAIAAMVVGRVPHAAALAASDLLARVPRLPWQAEWIHVARAPVVMDTSKAKQELGWRPQYTSAQALAAMAAVVGD